MWREYRRHYPPSSSIRRLKVRHVADLVATLVFITQWYRARVDAFAVLPNKTYTFHQNQDVQTQKLRLEEQQRSKLTGSEGLYTPSALGHSLLRIRPPKMFFARAIISALETLRWATRVGPV
jgi:hypothetical protein